MTKTISSLYIKLNDLIDTELRKDVDEIDDELISECVDGLVRIESPGKYTIDFYDLCDDVSAVLNGRNGAENKRRTIRIILVAAVITALLAASALAYSIIQYRIAGFPDRTEVVVNGLSGDENAKPVFGYIPDGYSLTYESDLKTLKIYTFTKGETALSLDISLEKANYGLNADESTKHEIKLGETTYVFYDDLSTEARFLLWDDNSCFYVMHGFLSESELLKMAQNIYWSK